MSEQTMTIHKAIPVNLAAQIARDYDKQIVVILGYDANAQVTYTATFGTDAKFKDAAAAWGDACTVAVGADLEARTTFEDYRTTLQAQYRERLDRLEAELASAGRELASYEKSYGTGSGEARARDIAQLLGYEGDLGAEKVDAFLVTKEGA